MFAACSNPAKEDRSDHEWFPPEGPKSRGRGWEGSGANLATDAVGAQLVRVGMV
jgi:hypothetical protein